jgi:hypothetical protein
VVAAGAKGFEVVERERVAAVAKLDAVVRL